MTLFMLRLFMYEHFNIKINVFIIAKTISHHLDQSYLNNSKRKEGADHSWLLRVTWGTYTLISTRRKLPSAPAMQSTSGSFLSVRKGNQSSSNTRVPGNWGCKSELAKGSGESWPKICLELWSNNKKWNLKN